MATSTVPSTNGNNEVRFKKNSTHELLAIAKGMKKDGFSEKEIAEETRLPIAIIHDIGRQRIK